MPTSFQEWMRLRFGLLILLLPLSLVIVSGVACRSEQQSNSDTPESEKSREKKEDSNDSAKADPLGDLKIATADPNEVVSHAVKSALIEISAPDLEELEPEVASQIKLSQEEFDKLLYSKATRTELATGFGMLGMVYQAYEMFDLAEQCYQNAQTVLPQDFRWYHFHGIICAETGDLNAAVEQFQTASQLNPEYLASFVRLGNAQTQLNQLDQARSSYDAALKIHPRSPAAHAGLADILSIETKYDTAILHYSTALEEAPFASRLHYSLALALRGAGDEAKAAEHMRQGGKVGILPRDPLHKRLQELLRGKTVHIIRGQAAFNAGEFESAAEEFKKAIEASPDSAVARVNLGSALGQLGKTDEAIKQYRDALKIDGASSPAHYNLSVLLVGRQEYEEAITHLEFVVRNSQTDLDARRYLAFSLRKVGRPSDAMSHYQAVLKTAPEDEGSLLAIMEMLIENHQYEDAKTLLETANRRFPNNGKTAYALATLLASCPIESLRDGDRAIELATAVLKAQNTILHAETLAMALAEKGRCEEAAVLQEKLLKTATEQGLDEQTVARMKATLARYEHGSPCRPPIGTIVEVKEEKD